MVGSKGWVDVQPLVGLLGLFQETILVHNDVLKHGIYTLPQAARLVGVKSRKPGDWFLTRRGRSVAILSPAYPAESGGGGMISFLDLVEAAVTARLREHVSMQTIRRLHQALSDLWQTHHPLGCQNLYVDDAGRRVFVEAAEAEGQNADFIEVLQRQHAMAAILKPVLNRLEFDLATGAAERLTLTPGVVLDPRRRYGQPIVRDARVPTAFEVPSGPQRSTKVTRLGPTTSL